MKSIKCVLNGEGGGEGAAECLGAGQESAFASTNT
mgnify:CR=1 FL=1